MIASFPIDPILQAQLVPNFDRAKHDAMKPLLDLILERACKELLPEVSLNTGAFWRSKVIANKQGAIYRTNPCITRSAYGGGIEIRVRFGAAQWWYPRGVWVQQPTDVFLDIIVRPVARNEKGVVATFSDFDTLHKEWQHEPHRLILPPRRTRNNLNPQKTPTQAEMLTFATRLGNPSTDIELVLPDSILSLRPFLQHALKRFVSARRAEVAQVELVEETVVGVLSATHLEQRIVIRHLLTALCTRPLVLLAGVSGSGKTQLAARIGRAWAMLRLSDAAKSGLNAVEKRLLDAGVLVPIDGKDGLWYEVRELDLSVENAEGTDERFEENEEEDTEPLEDALPEASEEEPDDVVISESPNFRLVPVQADWQESASLWGHYNPLSGGKFLASPALEVVLDAWARSQRSGIRTARTLVSHVLVLDEMNLARVEHYGADLLSAMERPGESTIRLHDAEQVRSAKGQEVPPRIGWPDGLRLIGTVNVDETTFAFAPKVLDRAAVLEFLDVDLPFVLERCGDKEELKRLRDWLNAVQEILRPQALHLGYRAAREIIANLRSQLGAVTGWTNEAMQPLLDQLLRNKVLPRVRGPRGAVESLLLDIIAFADKGVDGWKLHRKQLEVWCEQGFPDDMRPKTTVAVYNQSAEKALAMLDRARHLGFTSFF
jgi:hypothetical protein